MPLSFVYNIWMKTPIDSLTLNQGGSGYRYNSDSFLLADFFDPEGVDAMADLCAGVGVVSILIGLRNQRIDITAVEIQPQLAAYAQENARSSGIERFHMVNADLMTAPSLFPDRPFDAIVSNPPYRKAGSGRINPDPSKAVARHEMKMTLNGLVEVSSKIIREGGSLTIVMIYERLAEYRSILFSNGFCESRFQEVLSFKESEPKLFLSEARFQTDAKLKILKPVVLKADNGRDSEQFRRIMERYVPES